MVPIAHRCRKKIKKWKGEERPVPVLIRSNGLHHRYTHRSGLWRFFIATSHLINGLLHIYKLVADVEIKSKWGRGRGRIGEPYTCTTNQVSWASSSPHRSPGLWS